METPAQPADFRKTIRGPTEKAFSIPLALMTGESNVQKFRKYQDFSEAEDLARTCQMYAAAYTSTMLMRIKKEEPDYFEANGINEMEIKNKIQHNLCLDVNQYRSKVFQKTYVNIIDEAHVTDEIRRIYNGGMKFHPYL